MIQFNLLPDVKKQYVHARRTKRLISTFSLFTSAGAIAIVIVIFGYVNIQQKGHINNLTDDIESLTSDIQSTENLEQILTIQNQLDVLPDLHTTKPKYSRVFSYVKFFTPEEIKVASINVNDETSTISMSGTSVSKDEDGNSDSIATINKMVDNMKSVTYLFEGTNLEGTADSSTSFAFSNVATTLSGDDESANFTIRLTFDPMIFDNTNEVVMNLAGTKISTTDVEDKDGN